MTLDIINAIPVPAFLVGETDTLTDANAAFRQLFPQMRIGRSYLTVLRQPALVDLVEGQRAGAKTKSADLTNVGKTKGTFRATGGRLGQDVLICLQDVNETATAIQMRQNFVADLSHELKTPLTAISGILETSAGDVDALTHFLPALTTEVDRLKRLVADLLTLSRVENNEKRRPDQAVVLQELFEEASTSLTRLAQETGVRIASDMPKAPISFQGDPNEIVRALKNLIENGLHYSGTGGVVTVSGSTRDANVLIEVTNDGPGVDSHHIPRLTERFYRVDTHRSRDSGGSGLGLAIVKHVVSHHRGRMTIDSDANKGFRVVLMLPVDQSAQ